MLLAQSRPVSKIKAVLVKKFYTDDAPLRLPAKCWVQQNLPQICHVDMHCHILHRNREFCKEIIQIYMMQLTVDKCSEVKPILVRVVPSDGLGGLEEMLNLGLVEVRVPLVDKFIEEFTAFPYAHDRLVKFLVLLSLLLCLLRALILHVNCYRLFPGKLYIYSFP